MQLRNIVLATVTATTLFTGQVWRSRAGCRPAMTRTAITATATIRLLWPRRPLSSHPRPGPLRSRPAIAIIRRRLRHLLPRPRPYYEQGRYEADCHRGNTTAGTIFGALAGGLIGGAASHGNGGAVVGGVVLGGCLAT